MSMYKQYLTQAEYDRIVNNYSDPTTPPHCNATTFHQPGVCAFCDGFYKANPLFRPSSFAAPEANGWGGNMAPIVNDEKAIEEDRAWEKAVQDALDYHRFGWRDVVARIKAKFIGGNNEEPPGTT